MTRHLIIGCGYLGARVARLWRAGGDEVFALTRSPTRAAELQGDGLTPLVGDVCGELPDLPDVDDVLFAVGYDRGSGRELREVYVDGLQRVVERLPDSGGRFVYISSTGVYGQDDGGWVDEESVCEPTRVGGKACLEAEQALASSRFGSRLIVLRMAGLYGPGRLPRSQQLAAAKPLDASRHGYLNLIHIDDAARISVTAANSAVPPCAYCVSDGHPCLRQEYLEYAARELGAPTPKFAPPDTAEHAAAKPSGGGKRVSNRRLLEDLDISLQYPSYREGIAQIVLERNAN